MVEIQKQLRETMSQKLKDLGDEKLKEYSYDYDQYGMEEIIKKLTDDDLQYLVKEITDMGEGKEEFERVKAIIDDTRDKNIQRIRDQQKNGGKKEESKAVNKNWTKEEFALLVKALNKYPGGTRDRWKTVACFMGDSYTSKDIINMTQALQKKKAAAGKNKVKTRKTPQSNENGDAPKKDVKPEEDWTDEQQKKLEGGLKKFPKTLPPKERWGGIAKEVGEKTPKE